MENNIGYSLGLVEGYLERLVIENQVGADVALEHFHVVELRYKEAIDQAETWKARFEEIRTTVNRSGARFINV
jgi:hypothetical protein